ncbi:DUF368 domain-containing protein [Fervidobacterium nodosum]|uniref:DUF368 domain-containing protein n=1 Tax=Fervidobacterium nodosum (strain ATCC 35602 / DSM 5306 / Rt17-B1) TaxID=381764 RepID=A7HLU5_FERNB|nr:DUF368 domain-containing protein [Fervidobacterium nodosum]ABS60878.1 protein of unknown function DUF368 [Fervidobacterium nodosum Rt17-B1]
MDSIIKPIFAGFLMGLANVIPGVSGGTIAVITGVFERLIDIINKITKISLKKKDFIFILILGIGQIIGLLSGSKVLSWAFNNYSFYTYSFFFGLILFSLFNLKKDIMKFKILEFAIGAAIVIIPYILSHSNGSISVTKPTNINYFYLFVSGALAGASMILPGLSGSLVLMLLGFYERAIDTVSKITNIKSGNFNSSDLLFLVILGFGVLFGIGIIAKALKVWFEKARESILNFILGLVAGSLYPITPSFHGRGSTLWMLTWIAIGSLSVLLIEKVNKNQ